MAKERKTFPSGKRWLLLFYAVLILILLGVGTSSVRAEFIGNIQGGADFPQGVSSFADVLVSYSPGIVGGVPTEPHRGALNALGVPDFVGAEQCQDQASCTFVSLGKGGNIVVQFTDNKLMGSGDSSPDLWVFEVGSNVEDTFVEISKDGTNWFSVGKVFGSTSGADIDAFGFGPNDLFSFVRLTDDPDQGDHDSWTAGADIDAVGAISTRLQQIEQIRQTIPEPPSSQLIGLGLVALLLLCKNLRHLFETSLNSRQGVQATPTDVSQSSLKLRK